MREEVTLDLFGKAGVDKSKIMSLGQTATELGKTTKDAFDRIMKLGGMIGGNRRSSAGLFSYVSSATKLLSGNPLIRGIGAGSIGYGIYKLYTNLTGESKPADQVTAGDAEKYAEMLGAYHDEVVSSIESERSKLVLESRSDKVVTSASTATAAELITAAVAHYDSIATKVKTADDFDKFMTNFPEYAAVRSKIEAEIEEICSKASDTAKNAAIRQDLEDWAYVVLLADYVPKTFAPAVNADVELIKRKDITDSQVRLLNKELDEIETVIHADSEYQKANEAVSEMYKED